MNATLAPLFWNMRGVHRAERMELHVAERESGWVVEKLEDFPLEFERKCLETGSRAFDSFVFHCLRELQNAKAT
jgi:predicted aldo/keto reductase-like oxidoreductase